MKYDLVIWDFNGTLADDVHIGIESTNLLLRRRGLSEIESVERYRELFGFPIIDYYKKLGFDFEKEPYDIIAREWVDEYILREPTLTTNKNVEKTLAKIKALGISQIVLSSSEIGMLEGELSLLGIRDYFDAVLGIDNIHAGGKIEMAKKWAEGKSFSAVFIGDTTHDFDTAEAIGADCILYSGGHDAKYKLMSRTDRIVDDIYEVISFLK